MGIWDKIFSKSKEQKQTPSSPQRSETNYTKHDSRESQKDCVVRVFISSTFKDMMAERDELALYIFPELRKRCRERYVEFDGVDLRWGITEEQSKRGEVLPICLAMIERCHPYFVGLLGERYGWVPEGIDDELLIHQAWLDRHRDKSVTELEIIHGVLNDRVMKDMSYFYFRDKGVSFKVEEELKKESDYKPEPEEAHLKLEALKQQIKTSGCPVIDYPHIKALGQLVLEDLWCAIDKRFPASEIPSRLDRERMNHEAFAEARRKVYIGRQEYFNWLDGHIASDGPPLVLLGDSGSGKSALLSNWTETYRKDHPKDFMICHYIGGTPDSADHIKMLRRIMEEIRDRYVPNSKKDSSGIPTLAKGGEGGFSEDIPTDPNKVVEAFPRWLSRVPEKDKLVLILDGLNQIEDKEAAPDLGWLPEFIPGNVRLIISTLPGRSLEALKKRGWTERTVKEMERDEQERYIEEYLKRTGRRLDAKQIEMIVKEPQAANPLYLRTLLEELKVFGVYEKLNERIRHYLKAKTIDGLFTLMIERLEEHYERDRKGLVKDALTLIWASRRGLYETELLDMLGADGNPLPRAIWSPLYLAFEDSLVSRVGLLNFFHDYLKQAVESRYLHDEAAKRQTHIQLADYFEKLKLGGRKVDELPWQLAEGNSWHRLQGLLIECRFFLASWDANQYDVKAYWSRLEEDGYKMTEAYRAIIEAPQDADKDFVWVVSMMLNDTGHPAAAYSIRNFLTKECLKSGDLDNYHRSLGNEASILKARGELDEAMRLYKEQERICREFSNKDGLQAPLGNQLSIRHVRGEVDVAIRLNKEERIHREFSNKDSLQASLGNQASILYARGELDEAMRLSKEQERICREFGNKDGLSIAIGNQAVILKARGELDEAMRLHKEQERICRELGNKDGLQASLGSQAVILKARGELDEAMRLHKEKERICRELGNKDGLSVAIGNQASILYARGEHDEAMRLHKEQERICREFGNKDGLSIVIGNQASILKARGELDEAMRLYKEQERICREFGNKDGLQASIESQASILYARGEHDEAMRLHKEQERICREFGNKDGLQRSLCGQASIFYTRGELDEAMRLYKEQERICREFGNKDGLSIAIRNQAVILTTRGELDEAMRLHKEQERICRELGNQDSLQASLGSQALILTARGKLDEAMRLYKEQERICKEFGIFSGFAISLINQALLLSDKLGKHKDALFIAEMAYALAKRASLTALANQIKPILDGIRSRQ